MRPDAAVLCKCLSDLLDLREALRAASAVQASNAMQNQPLAPAEGMQMDHSESPQTHNIDPAIAGQSYGMSAGDSGGDEVEGGKKGGKRELSQSKRAAQNRAAQVSSHVIFDVFCPFHQIEERN